MFAPNEMRKNGRVSFYAGGTDADDLARPRERPPPPLLRQRTICPRCHNHLYSRNDGLALIALTVSLKKFDLGVRKDIVPKTVRLVVDVIDREMNRVGSSTTAAVFFEKSVFLLIHRRCHPDIRATRDEV